MLQNVFFQAARPVQCSSSTMHFSSALPATLMDLTILRLSSVLSPKTPVSKLAPFVFGKRPSAFRRIHQAAALTSTNVPKLEPFPEGRAVPRHSEILRGGLAASSSRTDSQALGMVKELERRVEALDETVQTEVGSYSRIYSSSTKLIYNDRNLLIMLHIIPRRSSWQLTKTF